MYPDILNYDQVVKVTGSFKTPMGCRSFLGVWENENGEQIHDGRNNLGVISLNLPRIALEAKGDEATFWKLLDERLVLARKALMTRIARLEGVKARVAPILYMEGACGVRLNADDDVSEIFKTVVRLFRWVTSASTKPLTRCSAASMFTTTSSSARKVSRLLNVCVRQWISGKKKRVMVSVSTARRVKTCATASAVSILLSLAWCRA